MVGLTQGVRVGLVMWHAQSRRVDATAQLDAAARVLRGLLTALPAVQNAGDSNNKTMTGTTDRFTFIGYLPTGLGTTRRSDMTLELRQRRLVLFWAPHRHEVTTAPAPPPVETELVGGVDRLQLSYWGTSSRDRQSRWLDKWDGPAPPDLIRVRLVFPKGDPRHWPDLIVASQL